MATLDLEEPLRPGVSVAWSAAGQAGWDGLKGYHESQGLEFEVQNRLVDQLNRFAWDPAKVLPEGSIVRAGEDTQAFRSELRAELSKRYGPQSMDLIGPMPPKRRGLPGALVLACADAKPRFPGALLTDNRTHAFSVEAGKTVMATGFGSWGGHAGNMGEDFVILADDLKGGCVLKLAMVGSGAGKAEHLFLARGSDLKTLGGGIQKIRAALEKPLPQDHRVTVNGKEWRYHHKLSTRDRFWMPALSFNLMSDHTQEFATPYHPHGKSAPHTSMWQIGKALQLLRFSLTEEGAFVEAAFVLGPDFLASGGQVPLEELPLLAREFVLDGPFLLALWRKGAELPYFACWVASPEVLARR